MRSSSRWCPRCPCPWKSSELVTAKAKLPRPAVVVVVVGRGVFAMARTRPRPKIVMLAIYPLLSLVKPFFKIVGSGLGPSLGLKPVDPARTRPEHVFTGSLQCTGLVWFGETMTLALMFAVMDLGFQRLMSPIDQSVNCEN